MTKIIFIYVGTHLEDVLIGKFDIAEIHSFCKKYGKKKIRFEVV